MNSKRTVVISSEFASFVGRGPCDPGALPDDALILGFGDIGEPAVMMLGKADLTDQAIDHLVVLAIGRAECLRLFAILPKAEGRWFLPADLRGLGRALVAVEGDSAASTMLRTARSMELLCQLFAALQAGRMVEVGGATTLNEQDITRVAAAHQIVNECWHEKLTVGIVARRCGLSKAKLTHGFRQLYQCTVPEAISARRLEQAKQLLAQSDLPISSIGYRCGYLSNASFTRAFARRFGMAPTEMRRLEMTP
ncbi:helix-turn-helix transcriptional regulator [Sphingopyxis sp. JAI128]|uniref:helix-turn-helix transcriptional regulator n=1 Tax=Sphingopyxis sp. JAI128 TaxID=2723066 RepID=UPI0016196F4E|nr:AraC family transcriptional regulator [Sphingopyxis sp. JAI128]MBB6424686.1 AraC family transcriptional activator of pyochelin receptor [Sphingopyxis sp. JAI128]